MRIGLDEVSVRKLAAYGRRVGKIPRDVVRDMVLDAIKDEPDPALVEPKKCLSPPIVFRGKSSCGPVVARGLCARHYQRMKYFVARGILNEGWMVRHGKALPTKSCPLVQGFVETLDTLPKKIPDHGKDTEWMWDWPHAHYERQRLEGLLVHALKTVETLPSLETLQEQTKALIEAKTLLQNPPSAGEVAPGVPLGTPGAPS